MSKNHPDEIYSDDEDRFIEPSREDIADEDDSDDSDDDNKSFVPR